MPLISDAGSSSKVAIYQIFCRPVHNRLAHLPFAKPWSLVAFLSFSKSRSHFKPAGSFEFKPEVFMHSTESLQSLV